MAAGKSRKRTRKAEIDDDKHDASADTNLHKSVLGGMKGGYRLDANEEDDKNLWRLPFGDKSIICQRHAQGDESTDASLVFTHGAGAGIDNPATADFAKGFANRSPVVCFQGTMNLQNRVKCFKAVLERETEIRALGGRSMGARAAVLTAKDSDHVKALILVSFPLTSERGGDSREDILLDIEKDVDVLFISGDGDKMCHVRHLNQVRQKMKARSWLVTIEGADHGMSWKRKAAVQAMRARTGEVAADWLSSRDLERTEMSLGWDEELQGLSAPAWRARSGARQPTVKQDSTIASESPPRKKRRHRRE